MAEIVSSFLGTQAYNRFPDSKGMVDLSLFGQFGHIPNYNVWAGNTPAISNPVVGRVLTSPRFFNDMPEPASWHGAWKAFIERHARTVNGLDATLTVENADMAYGRDGNVFEMPTKVSLAKSNVSVGITDLYCLPHLAFTRGWINYGIKNPQTQYADIITLKENFRPSDMLADYMAGSICWYEPDPTYSYPLKAWIHLNARPNESMPVKGEADNTGGAGSLSEADIPFTGIYIYGGAAFRLAKKLMDSSPMFGTSPLVAPYLIDEVSADLDAALTGASDDLIRAAAASLA